MSLNQKEKRVKKGEGREVREGGHINYKRKSSFPSFLAYTNQLRIKFPFTTTQEEEEEEEEEVQLQHFFRFSWLTPLTSQNLGASITTPISNLISVYTL